jgi:DNA-binding NarL/FixJ family response regulator
MERSLVRVLVVDDYEPFRRFVCSTLGQRPHLKVIGEASDGPEAVQKAEELQPDLVVLDIGIPTLNGIEATRRIRKLSTDSKILILTQESSADVAQEVLSLGALGYVVKSRAASELLAAVEAVCQGRRFVSKGISGDNPASAADHGFLNEALPSLASMQGEISRSHEVQFYSDDESFLVGFTRFVETRLNAGNAVIVAVTESHRDHLFQRLQAWGLNVGIAIEQGSLIPLDVAETLLTFMVDDLPDPVRFLKVTGNLLAAAAKAARGEHPRVAACGECSPILWAQGKADAAIQIEHLWDEIAKTCHVDVLCGYVMNSLERETESDFCQKVCAEHSSAYLN